jgi:hypothetical protein
MARVPDGASLFCAPISVDMVVIWRYYFAVPSHISLFHLSELESARMERFSKSLSAQFQRDIEPDTNTHLRTHFWR